MPPPRKGPVLLTSLIERLADALAAQVSTAPARAPRKRRMSAEGRARISAAAKKRWAEFRRKKAKQ